MTLRAYRDFDPNDPDNYNPNQEYDTGNDATDFQGTFLDQSQYNYAYRGQGAVTPKNRLYIVAGVLGLIAIGFAAAFAISSKAGGDMPIIVADGAAYKAKPETPGGIEIPFQDKMVFNRLDPEGQQVQAERLLPPPEEPMTLALQPKVREPSAPAPAAQLATEETAITNAKNTKVIVGAKPMVEPVVPAAKLEKMAPTQGAVPAPINDEVAPAAATIANSPVAKVETPKAVAPTSTLKAVPEKVAAVADKTSTLEPVEGTYGETPKAPVQTAKPTVVAAPVVTTVPTAKATPAVLGGSRIQLGSLPEKAAADRAIAKFTKEYAGVLGGAQLALVKADIPGKGTYWRVQSQPLDKATADKICSGIKAKGGACLLAK